MSLLLARGCDRLETQTRTRQATQHGNVSYSLGDAIDWKLKVFTMPRVIGFVPYSLGDAIDWKLILALAD